MKRRDSREPEVLLERLVREDFLDREGPLEPLDLLARSDRAALSDRMESGESSEDLEPPVIVDLSAAEASPETLDRLAPLDARAARERRADAVSLEFEASEEREALTDVLGFLEKRGRLDGRGELDPEDSLAREVSPERPDRLEFLDPVGDRA